MRGCARLGHRDVHPPAGIDLLARGWKEHDAVRGVYTVNSADGGRGVRGGHKREGLWVWMAKPHAWKPEERIPAGAGGRVVGQDVKTVSMALWSNGKQRLRT